MSEYYAALRFVVQRLREVTSKVYERGAVQGAETPYLTYEFTGESHISFVGKQIGLGRGELTVFGVGRGRPDAAKSLVEGVREVLHEASGEADGYHIESWETGPANIPVYSLNNIFYYELGARYRVVASRIPVRT